MGSYYNDQPDPYRRQGEPPLQPPRPPSPAYTYYRGSAPPPPPNAGHYAPGPPPSQVGTYIPVQQPAPPPTIVTVPRDIIYVQQPAPQYQNSMTSAFLSQPNRNQRVNSRMSTTQEGTADADDFFTEPPLAMPAQALQSATAQNVFREGQTHYETMGLRSNETQQIIMQVGTLILERMQARISDPASTEELRNIARGTFINVAKAFGVLVNPISRQAYDESIGLAPLQTEYYLPEYHEQYPSSRGSVRDSRLSGGQGALPTAPRPPAPRKLRKAWMPEKNPYESLCISPGASPAEIEKAFVGFEESFLKAQGTLDEVQLNLAKGRLAQRKKAFKFLMDPRNRRRYGQYLMYGSDASDEEDDYKRGDEVQDRNPNQVSHQHDAERVQADRRRQEAVERRNSIALRERLQTVLHSDRRNALPPPPPPGSVVSDVSSTAMKSNSPPMTTEQYERYIRLDAPRQTAAPSSRQAFQVSPTSDNIRTIQSNAGLSSSTVGALPARNTNLAAKIVQKPKSSGSERRDQRTSQVETPPIIRGVNATPSDAPASHRLPPAPHSRSSIPRYKRTKPDQEASTGLPSEDADDRSEDDGRREPPARGPSRTSTRPKPSST